MSPYPAPPPTHTPTPGFWTLPENADLPRHSPVLSVALEARRECHARRKQMGWGSKTAPPVPRLAWPFTSLSSAISLLSTGSQTVNKVFLIWLLWVAAMAPLCELDKTPPQSRHNPVSGHGFQPTPAPLDRISLLNSWTVKLVWCSPCHQPLHLSSLLPRHHHSYP